MQTRFVVTALTLALYAAVASATPAPPAVRVEIDALLTKMQSSSCEFNRNGTWYKADEAKTHLLRKLQYLEDKASLQSTEQFIELAATSSSMSGKAYLVRCGSAPPQPSAAWLSSELKALRVTGKK